MVSPQLDIDGRPSKRRRVSPEAASAQQKKGKEKKNKGRRDRRATSYHKGVGEMELVGEGTETPAGPKTPRLPKRQCALLIGFCGSGYSGMQMYVS